MPWVSTITARCAPRNCCSAKTAQWPSFVARNGPSIISLPCGLRRRCCSCEASPLNLLLLEPSEVVNGETTLTGRRAEHLLKVLRVAPGDSVRVGVVQGKLGSGQVMAIEGETVWLVVTLEREPVCELEVEL